MHSAQRNSRATEKHIVMPTTVVVVVVVTTTIIIIIWCKLLVIKFSIVKLSTTMKQSRKTQDINITLYTQNHRHRQLLIVQRKAMGIALSFNYTNINGCKVISLFSKVSWD
jgi:hypothetical protein